MEARQIQGKGKWSKVGEDNRKMRTTGKGEKGN